MTAAVAFKPDVKGYVEIFDNTFVNPNTTEKAKRLRVNRYTYGDRNSPLVTGRCSEMQIDMR